MTIELVTNETVTDPTASDPRTKKTKRITPEYDGKATKRKSKPIPAAAEEAMLAEPVEPEPVPLVAPKKPSATYLSADAREYKLSQLDVIDDPNSPLYDERVHFKVNQALVDSIRNDGQLEPGIVYPTGDDRYLILAGVQRFKALKELGGNRKFLAREAKPELGDLGAIWIQVTTNEIRTSDSLEQRARNIRRVMAATGDNVQQVATRFGVTAQSIRNALSLLDATKPVKDLLTKGLISDTTAVRLSRLEEDEQEKQAEKINKLAAKLGDGAKVATGQATSAKPKAVKITEQQLLSRKPSGKLVAEIAAKADLGKEANTLIQWIVGELDTESMLSLVPAVRKVWAELENATFEIEE